MKKHIITLTIALILGFGQLLKADEGMWIPLLLSKYNIADMQAKGFKLTAEDIYSINKASMKDAVVLFGGGCTAEMISNEGLLITNHHCGYSYIQTHSSLQNDYLTNGYWAMNKTEELLNPGLTATFLIRMEDVTQEILKNISDTTEASKRKEQIKNNIATITSKAIEGTHYKAEVESFYKGNQYFMFVSEVYTDVRLVGAPPSAIGKFGGDTDNWMWPRHTGDFSLFRIYANKDNQPAEYSPDNVPYKPKKAFPISLEGIKKGDFTMILGYPANTDEYLTSYAVEMISKTINPHRIRIRQKKIDLIDAAMNADQKTRIQYSAKYARISNAWKKWIGANKGLRKLKAIDKKKAIEAEFTKWVNNNAERKRKYGTLLSEYKEIYKQLSPLELADTYLDEIGFSADIAKYGRNYISLINLPKDTTAAAIKAKTEQLQTSAKGFFKNYDIELDKKLFAQLMELWSKQLDDEYLPDFVKVIAKEGKGDYVAYSDFIYSQSVLLNESKVYDFLDSYTPDKVSQLYADPIVNFYISIVNFYYDKIKDEMTLLKNKINDLDRVWMQALMEMEKDKVFYPDANFTMRLTYGKVDNYYPNDAVEYDYYTTLAGIMEKDDPKVYDYKVPKKLKQLYHQKDYGRYGENGKMNVCFIASNHTSGGNSGSPVINAKGHLIGINFDRNWEGTMSDIMYDPDQCRNISLDIRYALFIIDKFAGAGYLIDEMEIVK